MGSLVALYFNDVVVRRCLSLAKHRFTVRRMISWLVASYGCTCLPGRTAIFMRSAVRLAVFHIIIEPLQEDAGIYQRADRSSEDALS